MIRRMLSSELGKGSILLFITMSAFFFLNFLFHIIMARQLGPADYGIFAVLMTIIYIYGAPTEAIQNIASRYTSKLNLKKDHGKIKFFMIKTLKKGFKVALFLFIISILISWPLSYLLDIDIWLIILTNVVLFASFSLPVVRGILQGRKKFALLGKSMIIESILKLVISIFLVFIGFRVFGAIYGVVLSLLISFAISFEFNKKIVKSKEKKERFDQIKLESVPYFIAMFVILLIFGIDIILAKVFFSAESAGKYAVLSMLGKMIYFGTMSIGKAMFPLTSEKKDKKENPFELFKKAFILVLSICLISTLVLTLFPKLIISILYGLGYLDISSYLKYSAIAFSFLSLSNLILLYKLSTDQLKKAGFLIIFLIIEIVLLILFHSSILEYIIAFMVSNIIIFIGSLFLLGNEQKKN